jgi:hypothetical protein
MGTIILARVTGSEEATAYTPNGFGAKKWFFAEGYTGEGFDEWILVQNPYDDANMYTANVSIWYIVEGEGVHPVATQFSLNRGDRKTINENGVVGAGKNVSVKVISDKPVIAERAMYYNYGGWCTGGSQVYGYNEGAAGN